MLTVGVDVGGTKALGVAVTGGVVVAETRVPTPATAEDLVGCVAGMVGDLAKAAGTDVRAVGVGVPGLVDRRGVLRVAPNLPGVSNLGVKAELESRLGVPVRVDNDATCAVWGERELGAARGYDDVVLVTLGTGIGGGLITDGRVYRGSNGFAGEVGHMVIDPSGPLCPCGQRGCWERYASGSGLGRLGRLEVSRGGGERLVELAGGEPEAVRGEHVMAALAEGDAAAKRVVEEFCRWLALGLSNLANALDPQAFVVGGGVAEAGPALFEPAREAFTARISSQGLRAPVAPIPILPAELGARAGAIGAAFLAIDG